VDHKEKGQRFREGDDQIHSCRGGGRSFIHQNKNGYTRVGTAMGKERTNAVGTRGDVGKRDYHKRRGKKRGTQRTFRFVEGPRENHPSETSLLETFSVGGGMSRSLETKRKEKKRGISDGNRIGFSKGRFRRWSGGNTSVWGGGRRVSVVG